VNADGVNLLFLAGVQIGSILAPPVVLASQIYRRRFSVNRFLRASGALTFAIGGPVGAGLAYVRAATSSPSALGERAFRLRHDLSEVGPV
jgi:hypothetical protein